MRIFYDTGLKNRLKREVFLQNSESSNDFSKGLLKKMSPDYNGVTVYYIFSININFMLGED